MRRASTFNTDRIDHVYQDPHDPARRLHLHYGDLTDGSMLARLVADLSRMSSTTSARSRT